MIDKIDSYFKQKGRWFINYAPYQEHLDKMAEYLNTHGVSLDDYLSGVFYTTWGDLVYKGNYTPKLIFSKWSLEKYLDYKKLKEQDALSAENLEIEYIKRTAKYVKSIPNYFENNTGLLPDFLNDVRTNKLALSYCVLHPGFEKVTRSLDVDILDEYFEPERLYYMKDRVYRTIDIFKTIKENL